MKHAAQSVVLIVLLALAGFGRAQDFPKKPVRMVVHIGPGSSMDIVARVLGQKLNEAWAQPVIVDNRGGAGGTIGMDVVAKAAPDGYTVLFGASSVAIAASYYRKLPFDTLRDLEPVTQISSRHNVLVVSPSSPFNSVKDVIAAAKAKPGHLSYGSGGGSGSSDHMAGELFKLLAGIDVLHVPYKIIERIAADASRLLKTPEMRERLAGLGVDAEGTMPAEFKAYFRADIEKWRKVVKAAGVSAD